MFSLDEIRIPEEIENELEIEILRAFGSAIIEFEPVLFQKVLITSARMVITKEMFSKKLEEMAELGYVTSMMFHGMKCWKKLVDEEELEMQSLHPDEIRKILERGHSMMMTKSDIPSSSDHLVTDARYIASDILHLIRTRFMKNAKYDKAAQQQLLSQFREMRRALSESEGKFLAYVKQELPSLYTQLELILKAKGVDRLLPALRLVELGLIESD